MATLLSTSLLRGLGRSFGIVLGILLVLAAAPGHSDGGAVDDASPETASLMFIENVGQFDPRARFQVRGAGETLWLAEDAIWITVVKEKEEMSGSGGEWEPLSRSHPRSPAHGVNLKLTFPGANPHPRLESFGRQETTVSYFTGGDPGRWRSNVPTWGGVRYVELYPGVDLEINSQAGHLTWQLVSQSLSASQRAGLKGDPLLRVEGTDEVTVRQNRLCLGAGGGDFCLPILSDQMMGASKASIISTSDGAFDVSLPVVSPVVSDRYCLAYTLLDDPADLVYSTYLGGIARDEAWAVAVDQEGSAYITGYTNSIDFPTTVGSFDPAYNLGGDAYIAKLNASGTDLVYTTFLGGGGWDEGRALFTTASGEVYVTGTTSSVDFPTTTGAFDITFNGEGDAFVAELSSDGAALVFATYIGGQSGDVGNAIDRDNSGNIYIAGGTVSNDFPTTPSAFDTSYNDGGDGYLAKLSSDGADLIYGTYIGGSDEEAAYALAVAPACDAIITGNTRSDDFPTTPGAFDPTYNGSGIASLGDSFATRLNCDGTDLVYSTFLGGIDGETGYAIAVDDSGSAVMAGETDSGNFPTTPGAYDPTFNGNDELGRDTFVVKLNTTGTAVEYGTFLGGNNQESGFALALDEAGNAVVVGKTDSDDFPTTPGAFDTTFNGVPGLPDAFVSQLSASGAELIYSTFFDAGSSHGVAYDAIGHLVFVGRAGANLPTTLGAFDTTYNGSGDAFVAKLNPNEPTAVRLAELAAGAADRAAKLPLGLLVAGALALAFFAVRYRRSRPPLISGAAPPHKN